MTQHTINVKFTQMEFQQLKAVKEAKDGAVSRWIQRVMMEHVESRQHKQIDPNTLAETGALSYFNKEER